MNGLNTIHETVTSCFNLASLPLITDAFIATISLDEVLNVDALVPNKANVNSFMIELKVDGWVVFDEIAAYPVFAGEPLTIDLKRIKTIKIIGASGTKYRWIALGY